MRTSVRMLDDVALTEDLPQAGLVREHVRRVVEERIGKVVR